MLELTDAAGTKNLDWTKITVDTRPLTGAGQKSYEAYTRTLLKNSAGKLDFNKNGTNTYTGLREIESAGSDFEFSLQTDTNTAIADRVDITGYQFRNNQGATYETGDGTHQAAWGGRTAIGNKVEKNKLTVKGGTLNGVNGGAYGGLVENKKVIEIGRASCRERV